MALKIMQFLSIMLFTLVVGVFWGTWFSLSRSIASITPETFLEVGKAIIRNLATPMRALMPGAIVSALVSVLLVPEKSSAVSVPRRWGTSGLSKWASRAYRASRPSGSLRASASFQAKYMRSTGVLAPRRVPSWLS